MSLYARLGRDGRVLADTWCLLLLARAVVFGAGGGRGGGGGGNCPKSSFS